MTHTETSPLVIEVPNELMAMLRRSQDEPANATARARILMLSDAIPRGRTDESELQWRSTQYHAASAILALAGSVINQAVEGGMDSENCTPTMFLVLAMALSSLEVHVYDLRDKEG